MSTTEPAQLEPPPASFYEDLLRKPRAWPKDVIKSGLHIDDATYARLYKTIECQMHEQNLRDLRLNTKKNKERLQPVISAISNQFQDVFQGIPEPWRDRCIAEVARKCASEDRRRATKKDVESPAPSIAAESGRPPFGAKEVWGQREGGRRLMICQVYDLHEGRRGPEEVTVEDICFKNLVDFLSEDVFYDETYDIISCTGCAGETTPITDERSLKAAFMDLHAQGCDIFEIVVRRANIDTTDTRSCNVVVEDGIVVSSDHGIGSEARSARITPPPPPNATGHTRTDNQSGEAMRGTKRILEASSSSDAKRAKA